MQAETRLHEAGIASNRKSANYGEYVPGSCTHRPSHHESRQHPKSEFISAEGGVGDWGEVVTRYPYRKVRMDYLLSRGAKDLYFFKVKIPRSFKLPTILNLLVGDVD